MKLTLFIISAATLVACSCSKSVIGSGEKTSVLRLNECFKSVVSGKNTELCFDAVISDSRCPANANCIWEGAAVAKFTFTTNHNTTTFELSTVNLPNTYIKDTMISGYKIEFINLYPYPGLPDSQNNEIKAEVKISNL